jgi:hypothetical protein
VHPLQLVNDILDNFYGSEHYSTFDIKDAFWCCLLHPDSRRKSAFSTHNDLLEWIVMPQGCRNAATFFARIVQEVFRDAPRSIQKYQDDVFAHHKIILGLLQAH